MIVTLVNREEWNEEKNYREQLTTYLTSGIVKLSSCSTKEQWDNEARPLIVMEIFSEEMGDRGWWWGGQQTWGKQQSDVDK